MVSQALTASEWQAPVSIGIFKAGKHLGKSGRIYATICIFKEVQETTFNQME
jgi:hypothetical protein